MTGVSPGELDGLPADMAEFFIAACEYLAEKNEIKERDL